jgi:adenylate cyclase
MATATRPSRACSRRSPCDASHSEPVPRARIAGIIGCMPLALKLQQRATLAGCVVNTLSVTMLAIYMTVVFPPPDDATVLSRGGMLAATAVYTLIAGLTFYRSAQPEFRRMRRWMAEGRPPTREERTAVMRLPVLFARMTLVRWLIAVPLFAVPDLFASHEFAIEEAVTTALAGLSTSAAVYLTSEWQLRPAFALALDRSAPPEARSLGIGPRLVLTWVLCSGVPILMVALIPVGRQVDDPKDLIAPIWFAAGAAMLAGFIATKLATAAVARPVRQLRRAIDAVTEGDLDVSVPVDDGSEIGRLQAGFNGMVAGLREREQLRDLYGRQVGADVAREAIERGIALGGETREVSALFVDVVGSTQLAHRESPERVVALLNRFFDAVVHSVHGHGGLVNKFEGDAALCVFGAPVPQEDHAARALACARELRARIDELDGGLDAAIGVSCGTVVAGHVGAEARFEYTVVGDPVNEAARLTELAKQHDERLLACGDTVDAAGAEEAARWALDGEVTLRGRSCPTRIAVPAPPTARAGRARSAPRLTAR